MNNKGSIVLPSLVIAGVLGVVLGIYGGYLNHYRASQSIEEPKLGAFGDPFISTQLADSPQPGYILSTDGTDNSWIANTSGGSAWELFQTNFLTPTNTSLGIYVNSTSTFTEALQLGPDSRDNMLAITPQRTYQSTLAANGAINCDNTLNDRACLNIYSNHGAGQLEGLLEINIVNSSYDQSIFEIISSADISDGEIKISSPRPKIELIESDQSGNDGKFKLRVQGDQFDLSSRNASDSSFEEVLRVAQLEDLGGLTLLGYDGLKLDTGSASSTRIQMAYNGVADRIELQSQYVGNNDGDFAIIDIDSGGTNNTLFFIDTSETNFGFNTSTPNVQLQASLSTGAELILSRDDSSIVADNLLGGIGFDGTDGPVPTNILHAGAGIYCYAAESHGASDKGTYCTWNTHAINDNANTANIERLRVTSEGLVGIGGIPINSTLEVFGNASTTSFKTNNLFGSATTTANPSFTASDRSTIRVDASNEDITVNLPTCNTANEGLEYKIAKIDTSFNDVIVDPNGSETISLDTTFILTGQFQSGIIISCDSANSNWVVF